MAFNGDGPPSKRQRLEESSRRNHEYGGYEDEPRRKREENNKPNHVLLYAIINPVYPITAEVLHTISAPCGQVQRIVILKKNGLQAMVEFDTVESATRAKETLHGADIYPGCCTLKIDFARPTKLKVYKNDTDSWDYTTSKLGGAHRRQRVSLPLTLSPQSPGGARNSSDLYCRSKTPTTRAKIADTKSKTTGPVYEEVDSPPEVETLQLPSKTTSRSRSVSPGKLPVELTLKVKTQMSRLAMMQEILDSLRHDSETLSEAELDDLRAQVEETLKSFTKEHAHLEVVWPTAAVDHEYFAEDVHLQMQRAASEAKRIAARERVSRHAETSYPHQPKLPDIALPRFSGEYTDWPHFIDLFTTMIMKQPRLEDAEKFYYLKGCLDGEPAQLISNLSLSGASLESALDLLRTKYENKRQLIQTHLEHLWTLPYTTQHSSRSLSQLIATAIETRNAVNNLVEPDKLGDCLLVHHLTKHLDRATKKRLELSLGSTTSYPTFEYVTQFLTSRIRTLEMAESDQGKTTHLRQQTSAQPKAQVQGRSTAHEGSTRGSPMDNCDCCGGQHFIVTCKKFGGLSLHDRVEWAREKRLCFNCLGRHSIKACRTRKGCKTCRERHHTMLHGGSRNFSGSFLIQAPTRRDLDRLSSRTSSRRSPSPTSDKR